MLDLDDETYTTLQYYNDDNIELIDEVYNNLLSDSPNPICPNADCGKVASNKAYINLRLAGHAISVTQRLFMEKYYTDLRCTNPLRYRCLSQNNDLTIQYAILYFEEIDDEIEEKILIATCNPSLLDDSDNFNLDNSLNYPQESEIENGITIEEIYGGNPDVECSGDFIGRNVDRMNTEDISHSFFGNGTGIELANRTPPESNEDLFDRMNDLFYYTTTLDSELRLVGAAMITLFDVNNDAAFTVGYEQINDKAAQSVKMRNFIKRFGADLNGWLTINDGNIDGIAVTLNENIRPAFNGNFHRFQGLQILINDTEFTQIYISESTYEYNADTKEWSAWFCFDVEDHFGLDKHDALTYQSYHNGFAAWWILQHQRNQVPYHTRILVQAKISGKLF